MDGPLTTTHSVPILIHMVTVFLSTNITLFNKMDGDSTFQQMIMLETVGLKTVLLFMLLNEKKRIIYNIKR